MSFTMRDREMSFWPRLTSEVAEAPHWSIHQAKTQFSRVVRQAQGGEVQVVENHREIEGEPVVVISMKRLRSLLEPAQDRLADLFQPTPAPPIAKRLLVRPPAKNPAHLKL